MGRYCLFSSVLVCVCVCVYFPNAKWIFSGIKHQKNKHERFDANKVSLISYAFSVHVAKYALNRISSTIIEGVFVAIKHRQYRTRSAHPAIDAYLGVLQLYLRLPFSQNETILCQKFSICIHPCVCAKQSQLST